MASITPDDFDAININAQSTAEQQQSFREALEELQDASFEERFGLPVPARLALLGMGAGIVGAFGGMVHGWSQASLKYLASNAHRLPKSYNGWFFYHKRKSYYCATSAMATAFTTGLKLGAFVIGVFGTEAALDWARNGQKDAADTAMAVCLTGFAYAWAKNMTPVQAKQLINKGGKIGLGFGLAQDGLQFVRGANVWYLNDWFGIKPMRLVDRVYPEYAQQKSS